MSYKVVIDGITCYDTSVEREQTDRRLTIIDPHLEIELDSGGSFEFTMPPENKAYFDVDLMLSTIDVYEDNEIIWTGRATQSSKDFYDRERYRCEGALNYFHDSIQPNVEYSKIDPKLFLAALLNQHNAECPDNRKIIIGNWNFDYNYYKDEAVDQSVKKTIWRKTDWETTYECLQSMILDSLGGHFQVRKEGGTLWLDYWNNPETITVSNQTVDFGSNLLDYTRSYDASDVITEVIPICHYTYNGNDKVYDISSINDGKHYVRDYNAYKTYGRISKVIEVDMVKDLTDTVDIADETEKAEAKEKNRSIIEQTKQEMLLRAEVELKRNREEAFSIEISAADLSKYIVGANYRPFKVGEGVRVISAPHGIDEVLPVSKISMDLTSSKKQITIGNLKKKKLTQIYKPKKKS